MEIKTENEKGYICIRPVGRIDTMTAPEFQRALSEVSQKGSIYIVDLSAVTYMSSAGLRVVMVAAKASKTAEGKIIFCGMNSVVQEVFEISGFSTILNICADVASAEQQL